MEKINLDWFFKFRQYNAYSASYNIVEKTFNRGMGSLSLFRFYPDKKIVLINRSLANKSDCSKLNQFLNENNMNDWELRSIDYGYPDYFFHSFELL